MRNEDVTTTAILSDPAIKYMYDPDSKHSFATYGCECGDGWKDVIIEGLRTIAAIDYDKVLRIDQLKEKFGGIRLYMNFPEGCYPELYKQVTEIIKEVEHKAYHTCESCGTSEGVTTGPMSETKRYIMTLCGSCRSSK